jgi:hypothetical protein
MRRSRPPSGFGVIMNAAVIDKVIPDDPCRAVRLTAILRGFREHPSGSLPPTTSLR